MKRNTKARLVGWCVLGGLGLVVLLVLAIVAAIRSGGSFEPDHRHRQAARNWFDRTSGSVVEVEWKPLVTVELKGEKYQKLSCIWREHPGARLRKKQFFFRNGTLEIVSAWPTGEVPGYIEWGEKE